METWGSKDRRGGDGAAWGGDVVTAMVGCAALGAREGPKGRVPVGVPVCPLVWAGEPCLFSGGVGGAGQQPGRTGGVSLPCSWECRGGGCSDTGAFLGWGVLVGAVEGAP